MEIKRIFFRNISLTLYILTDIIYLKIAQPEIYIVQEVYYDD